MISVCFHFNHLELDDKEFKLFVFGLVGIGFILSTPLFVGAWMVAIKRVRGEEDEANLKCNLSPKNNPNVLDGLITRDLQPIVKDYLFSS